MEAVVHGPPAVAGVAVRDAPPARPAHAEHQPLSRHRRDGEGEDEREERKRLGGGAERRRHGWMSSESVGGRRSREEAEMVSSKRPS